MLQTATKLPIHRELFWTQQNRNTLRHHQLLSIPSDPLTRTLFVHAGIRDKTLKKYGSVEAVRQEGKKSLQSNKLDTILLNEILQTRHLAQGDEKSVCREVLRILKLAGAERLVVGHTPTPLLPGGSAGVPMSRSHHDKYVDSSSIWTKTCSWSARHYLYHRWRNLPQASPALPAVLSLNQTVLGGLSDSLLSFMAAAAGTRA